MSRRSPLVPWQAKFAALALIWGASFLLIKIGLSVLAPVQVATLRILTGTATVLVLAAMTGTRLPRDPRVWKHLAVTGFLLCALPFTLFPLGEERVSSALAGIGNATTPMAAVLFTLLMIPADRLPARKIGAVAVGFVGVVVITQPWQSAGRPDVLGFTMTLVAGASYGLGWTYLRRFLRGEDLGGLSLPAGQLVMASAQMLVIVALWWLFLRSTVPAPWSTHAPADGSVLPGVLSVLVLGAVGTGLAFALQFDVVRAVGAGRHHGDLRHPGGRRPARCPAAARAPGVAPGARCRDRPRRSGGDRPSRPAPGGRAHRHTGGVRRAGLRPQPASADLLRYWSNGVFQSVHPLPGSVPRLAPVTTTGPRPWRRRRATARSLAGHRPVSGRCGRMGG